MKNQKKCWNVDFDSSKEGFWCTKNNAKNRSSVQSTIFEKIQENMLKLVKNGEELHKLWTSQKLVKMPGYLWPKYCSIFKAMTDKFSGNVFLKPSKIILKRSDFFFLSKLAFLGPLLVWFLAKIWSDLSLIFTFFGLIF